MKNKPINIKQRLGLFSCALIFLIFLLPLSLSAQSNPSNGQDKSLAQQPADSVRLKLVMDKSSQLYLSKPDSAMIYANEAIELATKLDFKEDLGYAYKNLGLAYYVKGDYGKVMDYWTKSLEIFEEIDFKLGISNLQGNLGAVYQTKGDDETALEYFLNSLKNAEAVPDTLRIGSAYLNIGTVYVNDKNTYDQSLDAYSIALDMFRKVAYDRGIATVLINIGEIYIKKAEEAEEAKKPAIKTSEAEASLDYLEESLEMFQKLGMDHSLSLMMLGQAYVLMGRDQVAEEYFRDAIKTSGENQTRMEQTKAYIQLAKLQDDQEKYNQAIANYNNALELTKITGVIREQRDAYQGLAETYSELGDYKRAFDFKELYEEKKDSIQDENYVTEVGKLRFLFDTENKEKEIELLNAQNELSQVQIDRDAKAKMFLYITLGLFIAIIAGVIYQLLYIRKSNKRLAFERNKSEQILLNILPKETADELKEHGQIKAKQFESITVLFTDFKEFSLAAEEMPADALVKSVDFYFKAFDEITERHNLEKIKTIGDSYMCAGGLPTENDTHAEDAYHAAVEMLDFVNKVLNDPPKGVHPFEVRIGLNTGPVVAGVVGIKKFAYDIWGSTVNIASRMESSSIPGKINVSENTYQLLKDKQQFTYRGEIEVKNKQLLKMYFAEEEAAVVV